MGNKVLIQFVGKESLYLINKEINAKDYVNEMEEYLFYKKLQDQYVNGRFFVNCIVAFVKGGGGIEKQTIIKHNCTVSVYGRIAYIQSEDSDKIIKKQINSRGFRLIGKEVDKSEFNKAIAHNY